MIGEFQLYKELFHTDNLAVIQTVFRSMSF